VVIVGVPHFHRRGRAQIEAFIESEVLALRQTVSGGPLEASSGDICPKCAAGHDPTDRFCRSCGTHFQRSGG